MPLALIEVAFRTNSFVYLLKFGFLPYLWCVWIELILLKLKTEN